MLIFIDLETTGLEESAKICSAAALYEQKYIYELINEGKKIPAQASSIHHITNEDIKGKVAFKESGIYEFLNENNSSENTLVAHNIKFDLEKLASHGILWKGNVIDTLRVTKHLIPECELFGLQVLRYELQLYKNEETICNEYGIKDALVAHNALSDTLVLKLLFECLLEMEDEEKMQELSFKNVLLEKFSFGKHTGKYIEEVCINDRAYVEWLVQSANDLDEDLKYSINYYLQG
ncbi:MAG: 3'-5' exonuclease [Campylobacterota bacterium]|nr:3'-5' exonuclease [Campylobacterota bacterium]